MNRVNEFSEEVLQGSHDDNHISYVTADDAQYISSLSGIEGGSLTLEQLVALGVNPETVDPSMISGSGGMVHDMDGAIHLENFQGGNGDEMVVIATDDNVDLGQLQQLIQSGNVVLAPEDGDNMGGEGMEDSQVIHLTAEQTALLNSGVPLEQILSSIPGVSGNFAIADYGYQGALNFNGGISTGIGIPGAGNPNGVTYRCPSCPTMYVNANAFTKHMREKHFVRVYTCRNCPDFFDSLSNLFLHARRVHVDPKKPKKNPAHFKFHCETCGYMTNNGGTMEHHKRAHTGEKPYACDICGKRFAQKANMKTHRNRHTHTEKVFRCDTCNKGFASHDIYLAHLRTREHELREHYALISSSSLQLECLGCRSVFDNVYSLNKHFRCCRVVRTLQMKFRCVLCDVLLQDLISLKSHVKQHEGVTSIGCPVCGERGFPGFNQLNHHITRAHALKVNRRHVCRYCESTYENKRDLDAHVKQMHSDERNARQSRGAVGRLKCNYDNCDFTTNSIMLLDRHHSQHRQLEDEGFDANQPNLPPARNETRGPRKTLPRSLLSNERGHTSSRGRGGRRFTASDNFDSHNQHHMFEEEVIAMTGAVGFGHPDDEDAQSDWEAEFQEAMAMEDKIKSGFHDHDDFNEQASSLTSPVSANAEMPMDEDGHPDYTSNMPRKRGRKPGSGKRGGRGGAQKWAASLVPVWAGEGRSGRIRKLPARFVDYDTDVVAKAEPEEFDEQVYRQQYKASQAKREAAASRSHYRTPVKREPMVYNGEAFATYANIEDLEKSGLPLLVPEIVLEDANKPSALE